MVPIREEREGGADAPPFLSKRYSPKSLITAIRHSFPEATIVYKNGGCYGLYLILKDVYPEADAYYDPIEGHVYTKIGNHFYDISGMVQPPLDKLVRMRDDATLMRKIHRWKPNYKITLG